MAGKDNVVQYGGRVRKCFGFWKSFCKDRKVLKHVAGIKIPFTEKVIQTTPVREIRMKENEQEFVRQKLIDLQRSGCIEEIKRPTDGWISNIFLRPKKDGSYRLILNLKPLNKYIAYKKFKMPSIRTVVHMIKKDDQMISVDLRDAYSHAAMSRDHFRFLQFKFEGRYYRYKVLPNGIAVGPHFFVQMTKSISGYLRCNGIHIVIYIDDSLIIADSAERARRDCEFVIDTFKKCGFSINWDKSSLQPSTTVEFLGFMLDSAKMTITLTENKRADLLRVLRLAKHKSKVSLRFLAKVIGKMVAIFPASEEGQLHYRTLECLKTKCFHKYKKWCQKIVLPHNCISEINWWLQYLDSNLPCKNLRPPVFNATMYSDASGDAWGCVTSGGCANGAFSEKQKLCSINTKELMAIYFGISSLKDLLQNKNILCMCDNTTAVSCIVKRGSQDPTRDKVTRRIFELVWSLNSTLGCTHIPGESNRRADELSRRKFKNDRIDWTLHDSDMARVRKTLQFTPNIDLFASHLNHKYRPYCSYVRDPGAMHIDCFTLNWANWRPYAFPPFSILDRVMAKIEEDGVRDIAVIAPVWPSATFFARMLQHLKAPPVILDGAGSRLFLPWDQSKRCPVKNLRLALLHLCATCYAPSKCPREWLNILSPTHGRNQR